MPLNKPENNQSPYILLGISPTDVMTIELINQKFRSAAKKIHPDKHHITTTANNNNMAALVEARNFLVNKLNRCSQQGDNPRLQQFIDLVDYHINMARRIINDCNIENPSPYLIMKRDLIESALSQCLDLIDTQGYERPGGILGYLFLYGRIKCFTLTPFCQFYEIAANHILAPLEKQIELYESQADTLSQIKLSQLKCLVDEITYHICKASYDGLNVDACEKFDFAMSLSAYDSYLTAKSLYTRLHDVITEYSSRKEINSHRNLIGATLKILAGSFLLFLTILPTAGTILLSRSYRNAVYTTFFTTKCRSRLEQANHLLDNLAKTSFSKSYNL